MGASSFEFDAIPILGSGQYLVSAQKLIVGTGLEDGNGTTNAATPTCSNLKIVIQPLEQIYRKVTMCGTIHADDQGEESDPSQNGLSVFCSVNQDDPFHHVTAKLRDPTVPGTSNSVSKGTDEATGAEFWSCTLNPDNSVTVHLDSDLLL